MVVNYLTVKYNKIKNEIDILTNEINAHRALLGYTKVRANAEERGRKNFF